MQGKLNGTWKALAALLAGALLSGAGAWMVFAKDTVSRTEFQEAQAQWAEVRVEIHALTVSLAEFRGEFKEWKRGVTEKPNE